MASPQLTCFGKTDGAGSQTHAVFSAIALANRLGFQYVHTPFNSMEHDTDCNLWEAFMGFAKYIQPPGELRSFENAAIPPNDLPITYFAESYHRFTETDPSSYYLPVTEQLRADYFEGKAQTVTPSIAVHVRRGDIMYRSPERIITDDEYFSTIARVNETANWPVHVYTDGTDVEMKGFKEKGYHIHCRGSVCEAFHQMAVARTLIISNSSLSHCAGLLNRGRIVRPISNGIGGHKILDHWEAL